MHRKFPKVLCITIALLFPSPTATTAHEGKVGGGEGRPIIAQPYSGFGLTCCLLVGDEGVEKNMQIVISGLELKLKFRAWKRKGNLLWQLKGIHSSIGGVGGVTPKRGLCLDSLQGVM